MDTGAAGTSKRLEDATWRALQSPEYQWRGLRFMQLQATPTAGFPPVLCRGRPNRAVQDLGALMTARVRLVASPDFLPTHYPNLTEDARNSSDQGWVSWCILLELQTVYSCARVGPNALEPQVGLAVERAKELASQWIRLREEGATHLSFDDRARVGRLIREVLAGRGDRKVEGGFDAGFQDRERINELLDIECPWVIPPRKPKASELAVKQLRARGLSKDAIGAALQTARGLWNAEARASLESMPVTAADCLSVPPGPGVHSDTGADLSIHQPCAENNRMNTGTPNAASAGGASDTARLEHLRERFCQLLTAHPAIRQRVRDGYRRYREMVSEWRSENVRREQRRRDKLRDVLKQGLIEDPDLRRRDGWDMQTIHGAFPVEVVHEAEGKDPASLPRSWQRRAARAALEVLDSEIAESTTTASEGQRRRVERRLQAELRKGTHVKYTLSVWFKVPLGTDETPHPGKCSWESFRQLSPADQIHIAYARLGCLHDVLSLKPIIDPEQATLPSDKRGDLRPLMDHDMIYPNGGRTGSDASPKLDPHNLDPQFAEALLALIEGEVRGQQAVQASAGLTGQPPQPVALPPGISTPSMEHDSEVATFEHGEDFTWVLWAGVKYDFAKGNQAESMRALWQSWERGGRRNGCGLSEKTIGAKCDTSSSEFRLAQVFRNHPAFGTAIRSVSKGVFALYSPESQENPTS